MHKTIGNHRSSAVSLAALLAGLLAASPLPAAETLVFDQPECAGMSGFRAQWNQPIPVAQDGARLLKDNVVKDRGQTAVWDGVNPGPLAFDAVHRQLLVRFPGAAEKIAEALAAGKTVAKVELVLPYLDEEIWPTGSGARITRAPTATATGRTGIATSCIASSGRIGTPSRTCCASRGRPTRPTAQPTTPPSTARSTGNGSARPTRRRIGSPSDSGRWRFPRTSPAGGWT